MHYIVYNSEKSLFRYDGGVAVYTERLENGRLISSDFQGAGMPLHDDAVLHGHRGVPAFLLELDGRDASFGWRFGGWKTETVPDGREKGELTLLSERFGVSLRVVTLCCDCAVMTRQLYLKNLTEHPVSITKAAPLAGSLWQQSDNVNDSADGLEKNVFSVGSFRGRKWGMEGIFAWTDIPGNMELAFGSEIGKSGHGHPFAIVKNKIWGGYFLCQLAWSSNWKFRFFHEFTANPSVNGQDTRLLFSVGPDAPAPMRVIAPGEELALPAVHFGLQYGNLDDSIQSLHSYQRRYLLARPAGGQELVSYDGWGYHGWDYKEDILFREIDRAAELGAEIYMVDAGWYGDAGTGWHDTVGDWETSRLPHDLYPIIDYAHKKGLKFGLWVEPESAGRNSRLAKEHADWFTKLYGVTAELSLDLSNPAVEEWLLGQLRGILDRYPIDLLRLDSNTSYINGFAENSGYTENILWRYCEALYRIFDRIREEYPDLMLENCAAGGARTDLGMMQRFSKTQISDWFRLPRAIRLISGMSMCLPPECLLIQYGEAIDAYRCGSAETQMQMTILGVPKISGISPIEEPVNPTLWKLLTRYIGIYKDFIRPIQRTCRVFHHTPVIPGVSGTGWAALEFAAPEGDRGYLFVSRLPETKEDTFTINPRGFDTGKQYCLTFCASGKTFRLDGQTMMNGIPILLESSLTSELILIKETFSD